MNQALSPASAVNPREPKPKGPKHQPKKPSPAEAARERQLALDIAFRWMNKKPLVPHLPHPNHQKRKELAHEYASKAAKDNRSDPFVYRRVYHRVMMGYLDSLDFNSDYRPGV